MANLGTLWFGADIDLTNLKQKIQQGNQGILDALKLDYNQSSYQQMVDKLRSELSKEVFDVKVNADLSQVRQSIESVQRGGQINPINTSSIRSADSLIERLSTIERRIEGATKAMNGFKNFYDEALRTRGTKDPVTIAWKNSYEDARRTVAALREEQNSLYKSLNTSTGAHRSNTTAMTQASKAAKELNSDTIRLNTTLAGGIHISTRLGSVLSSLFGIHAARQFLEQVIEIGGQLEKQRISMQAILGDIAKANELFEQIKALALKSPFGVVELDQYSKQLAAYGFEANELYDMTKRLADISAGAGQDIGRLTLALGHVRSATYLTGITLRQFSMNNIPMLKMLADYYSELEGRIVSTAEVQKRISKREVSYEDVITQIKRLTDEGGMFYNMQEKISESLAAKFKNLSDAFDIMYGEIAESKVGDMLKSTATSLTLLAKNWQVVARVLGVAVSIFGSFKVALAAQNFLMNNLNKTTIAAALNHGKLTAAMIDRYVVEGRITKEELLRAVATKKVSAADAELAAASFNVTRAQLEQIALTGRYKGMLAETSVATSRFTVKQLRMMASLRSGNLTAFQAGLTRLRLGFQMTGNAALFLGRSIKALFLNPATISFLAITSAIEAIMHFKQKNDDLKESIRDVQQAANEGYKNLYDAFERVANVNVEGLNKKDLKNGIDEIIQTLNEYDPAINEIMKEADSIKDLAEKYIYLRDQLKETRDAYAEVEDTSTAAIDANESTGNMFNDTMTENIEDYIEKMNEVQKKEDEMFQYRIQLYQQLDAVNDDSFQKDRRNADGTMKTLHEQISLLFENKRAYDMFEVAVHRGGGELYTAFVQYKQVLQDSNGVMKNDLIPDLQSFAKYLDSSYAGRWGEGWKASSTHVRTAMLEVKKLLESIPGMTEDIERDLLDRIFNKEWGLKIDLDSREAKKELTELQEYLQSITTKDWVVKVKAEADVTDVIEDVKKSINDIKTNMPVIRGAVEKGGYSEDTLKDYGQKLYAAETNLVKTEEARKKDVEQLTKSLNDYIDSVQGADATQKDAARLMANMYKQQKNNEAFVNSGFVLDTETKGSGGSKKDTQLERAKTYFDEIKSFLDEYKKYVEVYGKDKSIDLLEKMFPTTKGRGQEIVKNFKDVLLKIKNSLPMDSEARKKFGISIDKYISDFDLNEAKKVIDAALKDMQDYIASQSEKYNLYKALFEKTGNKKFAEAAFADGRVWDDVARQFEDSLKEITGGDIFDYEGYAGAAEEYYKGNKEAFELWKKIVEITKKNYTDALTKGADALAKQMTIEEKIVAAEERIAELREKRNNETNGEVQKSLDLQIGAASKELDKLNYEKFQQSIEYLEFFGATLALTDSEVQKIGMDIKTMLLKELSNGTITAHDYAKTIKDVNERMEESSKTVRGGFAAFLQGGQKGVVDMRNNTVAKWAIEVERAQKDIQEAQRKGDTKALFAAIQRGTAAEKELEAASKQLGISVKQLQMLSKLSYALSVYQGLLEGFQKVAQNLSEMFDALGNDKLANTFEDLSDGINAFSSALKPINNLVQNAMNGNVTGIVSSAISAPVEMFTAPITAFAKLHDKQMEREIQASKQRVKEMENLTKNLETALGRSLSGVYGIKASESMLKELEEKIFSWQWVEDKNKPIYGKYNQVKGYKMTRQYQRKDYMLPETEEALNRAKETKTYYDAQYASLRAQQDEIRHQMDMEQGKKKSNAQAIEDYKQQIAEIEDEIKNFSLDMAKALYDIDVKSWADELGDALFEAWQKGESGAEAFKKKVGEIIAETTKNIVSQKIIGKALEKVEQYIADSMVASSGELDPVAFAKGLSEKLNMAFAEIDSTLAPALDATEAAISKYGYSMKEAGESGVSAGIKSITEETADLLASYVNAIRADLSLVREVQITHIPIISEACMRGNILAEQQVQEQRQIAANTLRNAEAAELIYEILHNNVLGANKFAVA